MLRPHWWQKPRPVSVVVDNPSWILPWAEHLVQRIREGGDVAELVRDYGDVRTGAVAFYLGCIRIAPPAIIARNRRNVVIHESDLPKGRGFAPLTWQILEGAHKIPVCLIEAAAEADAGDIIYRDELVFDGTELVGELRSKLGSLSVELALRFLSEPSPPEGRPQSGDASYFARRRPADSRMDPTRTIADQFNLLRVVDNERYPAFFELHGRRYRLRIDAWDDV
jgi:methionyl-tRNA formyltransferase